MKTDTGNIFDGTHGKANRIKPGLRVYNGGRWTVLCFAEKPNTNVALLMRINDGCFVTVRNLTKGIGAYWWDWGNYHMDILAAAKDYETRKKNL